MFKLSRSLRPSPLTPFILAAVLLLPALQGAPASLDEGRIREDLAAIARFDHRLPGSPQSNQAADYIEDQLAELDQVETLTLRFSTEYPEIIQSRMSVDLNGRERDIPLYPLRPNATILPTTPEDGIQGELIYAGRGDILEYGTRDPENKIVLLDYDSFDSWQTAFALGARAVVLVGQPGDTPPLPVHLNMPANLLRFYVPADSLPLPPAEMEGTSVHLVSHLRWQTGPSRVLAARIRGTDPEKRDPVVLAAPFDTYGNVPQLAGGARRAANVALLLEYARFFADQPPDRDVVCLFSGARTHYHQGARFFYEATQISDSDLAGHREANREESKAWQNALALLESKGLNAPNDAEGGTVLNRFFGEVAQFMRDDLAAANQRLRLDPAFEETPQLQEKWDRQFEQQRLIDDLRRAIFENAFAEFVTAIEAFAQGSGPLPEAAKSLAKDPAASRKIVQAELIPILGKLRQETETRLRKRLAELEKQAAYWQQTERLRALISGGIHLHIALNLGDRSTRWGPVIGHSNNELSGLTPYPGADQPGFYTRLLAQLGEIAAARPDATGNLAARTLKDPRAGPAFAAAPHTSSGQIAGAFGTYNFALMTENDARSRDGHPADTVERLRLDPLLAQGTEALALIEGILARSDLAVTRPVQVTAQSKYPGWRNGRPWGDSALLTVIGGLAENRPAADALLAQRMGIGQRESHWADIADTSQFRDFSPFAITRVNQLGGFTTVGLPVLYDGEPQFILLGTQFNDFGKVEYISSQATQMANFSATVRASLFPAEGISIVSMPAHKTQDNSFKFLKGASNFTFPQDRVLWGISKNIAFAYIAERERHSGVKVFQPLGPVLMAKADEDPIRSDGLPQQALRAPTRSNRLSAANLWELNETRFARMRTKGVSRLDLERFHNRALAANEQADDTTDLADQEALYLTSTSLSHRVYDPLRASMDDLVTAIVVLLLLSLPFAFALERLLIGATSIYGRIGGFTGFFILTFGLLYLLHPGFAISSAPMIIFLAFTLLGLSAIVIHMLVRRFGQELKMIQGQGQQAHEAETSRTGTMLAAVAMGMSTMRRRPTRTFLTAVTVITLTFTILCFTSFSRDLGVRASYLGPTPEDLPDAVLVRDLNFKPLPPGVRPMLLRLQESSSVLASRWWLSRQSNEHPGILLSNPQTGQALEIEALLGLDPRETEAWPALGEIGGQREAGPDLRATLESGALHLPPFIMDRLGVTPGDQVLLRGRKLTVAPPLETDRLQVLRGPDLEPLLPVDQRQVSTEAAETAASTPGEEADVEVDFVRLSAGEVAVASAEVVRALGGQPYLTTLYPSPSSDSQAIADRVAALVTMPVWVSGEGGVERLILTFLTSVSGLFAVAVPLFLGGLIIFGTLLGSINDREREIYTFSALGLGPSHVGMLFFAEAGVYAIVGGMGGQLLAQITAYAAGILAERGWIEPFTINFSSTNSLFAMGVVMAVVLVSSLYPAVRASRSANPGLARTWKMPEPQNGVIELTFPFTVSDYDFAGVLSFLAEHFRSFDDAGLGSFATTWAEIRRRPEGNLELRAELALAPFDLGVTERIELAGRPSPIEGVDEVCLRIERLSGAENDWVRGTRVFLKTLRTQFLVWRTLTDDKIERYREQTFLEIGEA